MIGRMPGTAGDIELLAAGSTVVRRDALRGQIWSATPYRVVNDSGNELMIACWPGVEMLAPTTWIEWLQTGDDQVRKQAVPNLAAGQWDLARWTWRDTTLLSWFGTDIYFSVHRFIRPDRPACDWYVNFERPCRRTKIGIDNFDLLVDLVVRPDLSGYTWKDEDEYAHARRLGLIDEVTHASVDEARQQVLALIESRHGPFAQDLSAWRHDPGWVTPVLPADALTLPTAL